MGNNVGDTWQPNVLPEEVTDLMQINIWMYDFFKSNINSWYIIYQQFGCHHADFKTKDLDGNEVSDTEVAITTGLEAFPLPKPAEVYLKKWFKTKYLKFFYKNSDEIIEAGTNIANKEATNDLVKFTKRYYGGNVTVMKDGKDLFRIHQPGKHHFDDANITIVTQQYNRKLGVMEDVTKKPAVLFDEETLEMYRKALRQVDGYNFRTKGGR